MPPARPSAVETAARPARLAAGTVNALKEVYRAVALQVPLGQTLGQLARQVCESTGAAAAIVFGLRGERLEALAANGDLPLWMRPPLWMPLAEAPWWRLRGRTVRMSDEAVWLPYLGLAGGAGFCWSDRLTTAAGEVVGCLTLFFHGSHQREWRWEEVEEWKSLAALAIEQANLLEDLRYRAEHDLVTGTWNRRRLEEELLRLRDGGRAPAALVLVALDGARRVREILGEETGDALLKEAASRLARLPEAGCLARLSGDEMAVLAPPGRSPDEVGRKLLEALDAPFQVEGHEIHAHPAVGVAEAGQGAAEIREWLRRARAAVAAARECRNGGRCVVFTPAVALHSPENLEMERRLRGAATRGELLLHYQPQVRVPDRRIAGYEALMRWMSPEVGMVSPGAFIPLAEETGLVVEMGRWALEEACRQARQWELAGLPARVGVNVSALQLADSNFVAHVEHALRTTGLTPRLLELEITESAVIENLQASVERMETLRRLGVEFALDDFGTGSSSLAYLKDLPVDRIKIDRSFLRELEGSSAPLLASIIAMAHRLGLPVIVEGVETAEQWAALEQMGADEVQGYLTGKPVVAGEAEALARRRAEEAQSDI